MKNTIITIILLMAGLSLFGLYISGVVYIFVYAHDSEQKRNILAPVFLVWIASFLFIQAAIYRIKRAPSLLAGIWMLIIMVSIPIHAIMFFVI